MIDMQALYEAITEVSPEVRSMTDAELLIAYGDAELNDLMPMWELMLERERRNI